MNEALRLSSFNPGMDAPPPPRLGVDTVNLPLEENIRWEMYTRPKFYLFVVLMGLILGGMAGAKFWMPDYRSEGLIRVDPNNVHVLSSDNSMTMPSYEAFMASQLTFLKSSMLIDMAMQQEEWKKLNRVGCENEDFASHMSVVRVPGSELITITFRDSSPEAAAAGVHAVIGAYQTIGSDDVKVRNALKSNALREYQKSLTKELNQLQDQMASFGTEFGTDDLQPYYMLNLQELGKVSTLLRETEQMLSRQEQTRNGNVVIPNTFSADYAANDPLMQEYLKEKTDLEKTLNKLSLTLGANHRSVQTIQASLDWVNKSIEQRNHDLASTSGPGVKKELAEIGGMPALTTVESLRERQQGLKDLYKRTLDQTAEIGKRNMQIRRLQVTAAATQQRLDDVQRRIEQFNVELPASDRIHVLNNASVPPMPMRTEQRASIFIGSILGGILCLGFVLMLGLNNPRLRTARDVRVMAGRVPVVGVLPKLPHGRAKAEQTALVARSVRQLSSRLQIWRGSGERRILAITSSSAGTGKTGLALALGVSFAEANCRTLLIDCDLLGRGLTARAENITVDSIGRIIEYEKSINEQLEESVRLVNRLHQELVASPTTPPGTESSRQVAPARGGTMGLMEAIRGEAVEKCIQPTRTPGLFVLPLGSIAAQRPENLSLIGLRRLFGRVRKQYDMIIIDTGPMSVSPETSLVAAEADGVLLAVAQGDKRSFVRKAVDQLSAINAQMVGIVYNRADKTEVEVAEGKYRLTPPTHTSSSDNAASAEEFLSGPISLVAANSPASVRDEEMSHT